MCCAVAAKSSYRHASKMPHPLRQIGLSYRGFVELWYAFGSFQPFITNDNVESSNRWAILSWKFNVPKCQLCLAMASSEQRRVGKDGVSTFSSRGLPNHEK